MRLAPQKRAEWRRIRDLADGVPEVVLTRTGLVEVTRMGEGDPIVLVPGLAGGQKLVSPLARRLSHRHEVILFDLRGDRRRVPQPADSTLADYADDVADLIDGLRLERPTVLGVSFGGAVALELAVEHPGSLGSLIVQGAEARFRGGLGAKIARRVLERYPLPNDSGFINQFFNLLHGGRPGEGELSEFVVRRCWETDQSVMAGRLRALEGYDVSDRLWRVAAPTLVLAGSRDVIVSPGRHRALADAIPGARFASLEGAGHIGFLTHRDEVARQVHRHIRAGVRATS